jgi:hypothetical protein
MRRRTPAPVSNRPKPASATSPASSPVFASCGPEVPEPLEEPLGGALENCDASLPLEDDEDGEDDPDEDEPPPDEPPPEELPPEEPPPDPDPPPEPWEPNGSWYCWSLGLCAKTAVGRPSTRAATATVTERLSFIAATL